MQSEPLRGADEVGLDRVPREVGDDYCVRTEVGEVPRDVRRRLEAALDELDRAAEHPHGAGAGLPDRSRRPAHHWMGLRLCPRAERRRLGVARLEVAEVVRVDPEAPGEHVPADRVPRPAGAGAPGQAPERQPAALVRELLQHLVRLRLDSVEQEVHVVAALVEQPEHGGE